MTGQIVHGDIVFSVAGLADEPDVRRLLRENAVGGKYEISLEREPHAFTDAGPVKAHAFVLARNRDTGQAIGLCERVVRNGFVNGQVHPLAYLGGLRISRDHRHRARILRGGFEALRALAEQPDELPYALTSITSDNAVARRLLTAGVPGLPLYRSVGDFSTFALRPRRMGLVTGISVGSDGDMAALSEFLNRHNARFQFSACWSEKDLRDLLVRGLQPEHFVLARRNGRIVGSLAVWDQTGFRQVVLRRYPPWVGGLRPLFNLAAPIARLPSLPKPGVVLRQATLSHLAVEDDDPVVFAALLDAGLDQTRQRRLDAAIVGFASARPWRNILLQRHRALEYRTTLYVAHWAAAAGDVDALSTATPHPELGLL